MHTPKNRSESQHKKKQAALEFQRRLATAILNLPKDGEASTGFYVLDHKGDFCETLPRETIEKIIIQTPEGILALALISH